MVFTLTKRILTGVDFRLLLKLGYNMGWKSFRAISKFEKRKKQGKLYPAFLMISITDNCNLNCQGCWVKIDNKSKGMDFQTLDNIISNSKNQGSYFFGILGGEPLLYPQLFELLKKHSDCYFQLFTNGTVISESVAEKIRKLGNVSPLISVEGLEDVSDIRRGAQDVFSKTMNGIDECVKNKLFTGVATSICKSNINDLATEEFVQKCIDKGIHYLWYYIYRPVGSNPTPELALSEEEILKLRKFIVDIRSKVPLMIIDTYWDHKGNAVCPGATGMSHHINPSGDIEFCPPVQFACENVNDGKNLEGVFENSVFIKSLREEIPKHTRGCMLLEDPAKLKTIVKHLNAYDSSGRNTAFEELMKMNILPGHNIPGKEIPEKSLLYKFAKKNWFFGFGAYG